MRLGFLSDLHITYNTVMLEQALDVVSRVARENSIDRLFIAGDVTNNYKTTLDFVKRLNELGIETQTIFGNHEYWSISYEKALELDDENYISGQAIQINKSNVVIAIDGFFDYTFVLDTDNPVNRKLLIKEKEALTVVGERYFDLARNKIKNYEFVFNDMYKKLETLLKENKDKNIILMMHYVPHSNFIAYKENDEIWNYNNSFMGSAKYAKLAKEYGVSKFIFGHTHTSKTETIDGTEYICNPIGYKNLEFNCSFEEQVRKRLTIVDIQE